MSREKPPSFLAWLRKQKKRDDPIGDLAQDYIMDSKRFRHKDVTSLLNRIKRVADSGKAEEAYWMALEEYEETFFKGVNE